MSLRGLSTRSRYLAFLMLDAGMFADSSGLGSDGVRTLAKRFGYSPKCFSDAVRELVTAKMLVLGSQPTKGRPKVTYALNPDFEAIPYKGHHLDRAHQLLSDASLDLSIVQRVVLADLWLGIDYKTLQLGAKSCVVYDLSVRNLARRTGQSKTTIHRVLASLEDKEFILSGKGSFDRNYKKGLCTTYYLLGPASLTDLTVAEWDIQLLPQISKFLSNVQDYSLEETFGLSRTPRYPKFIKARLGWLEDFRLRIGLVRALCNRFSNVPSWSPEDAGHAMLLEAECFILKRSGLKNLIVPAFRGLENLDISLSSEEDELLEVIKYISGCLAVFLNFNIMADVVLRGKLKNCYKKRYLVVRLVAVEKVFSLKVGFFEISENNF